MIASASLFLLAVLFLIPAKTIAQQDSCHLRISLLTVTPGEELYSTFGHSALRVTDSVRHTDIVYNYGTFNFDEPGFYRKFIRGKLMYYLSTEDFESFQYASKLQNRGITEQLLHLKCDEKRNIMKLLGNNLMAQNRFYKYDFLFDNCTTRLRDLIDDATGDSIKFRKILSTEATFRDLIYEYLNYNDKQWSKLGIDILLGSKTDAAMSPYQTMFLPDYLMKSLDSATLQSASLVSRKQPLYIIHHEDVGNHNLTQPMFIFTCLFLVIALLSFSKNKSIQAVLCSFDHFIIFLTGILGVLLLFMWFGTDHLMTKNNYNLLWAWPLNVVAAFYIHSKAKWAKVYFLLYAIANLLLIACWAIIPQHLNPALIPIIGMLIFRSYLYISKKN